MHTHNQVHNQAQKTRTKPQVIIRMIEENEQSCELTVVIFTKPTAEQKAKLLKARIENNMV